MTVKWTISDGTTTVALAYNPYQMTSPFLPKNISVSTPLNLVTTEPSVATDWTFNGYVYTEAEYNKLKLWHSKDVILELTDHLGRSWNVLSYKLDITERRNTRSNSHRYQYNWSVLNMGPA